MKYGFTAFLFTKFFDRDVLNFLKDRDIVSTDGFKKKLHKEYREIIKRTPTIDTGSFLNLSGQMST